ncbi:MAG TPA: hypothetical protein VGE36_04395 [Roseateles sp.]
MADVDLIFRRPPTSGSTADLVFGEDAEVVELSADVALPALGLEVTLAAPNDAATDVELPALSISAQLGPAADLSADVALPGLGIDVLALSLTGIVYDAAADVQLPPLQVAAAIGPANDLAVDVALPGLGIAAQLTVSLNVERPLVGEIRARHQVARQVVAGVQSSVSPTQRVVTGAGARHQNARSAQVSAGARHQALGALQRAVGARHTSFDAIQAEARVHHQVMVRHQAESGARHQIAAALAINVRARHQERYRDRRADVRAGHQAAQPLRHDIRSRAGAAAALGRAWGARHQITMPPPAGISQPPEPPVKEPCYTPSGDLVFKRPPARSADLIFICENHAGPGPGTVIVPIRKAYIVANSVSLVRVSDGQPIPPDSLTLQLDYQSWAWGFSAAVPAHLLSLVEPTEEGPVELLATVNGMQFRLLAEQVGRERAFRSNSVRVQGRGRIAELDEDYAPRLSFGNTVALTAQQLMADALTLNGIPLDWAVDWHLDDWLVPAGAWSHYGTHISALNTIAQAAGGYLLPHASAKSLKVLHRYPVAPWQWADVTPDLVLPADLARRESKDWKARPAYNRVFVQGQAQGLLGQVTRDGTAGDLIAPLVVDPLMTDVAAIRQRGRAELGQGGRQIGVGLGLPVLAETGIVLPGTFLNYTDDSGDVRGLVRSVSIETAFPNVWQTIGVETHV